MKPRFVLAWVQSVHSKPTHGELDVPCVFVEHPTRGWEIPGGHLHEDETPEEALIRELKEETGLIGTIHCWNKSYYPEGWVAHVYVENSYSPSSWTVEDRSVKMIQWWKNVPPVTMWTHQEFIELNAIFNTCQSINEDRVDKR